MKLPHRRQFLHLAAGAAALPADVAHRMGASLSDAAGAHHRRLCRWRRGRHPCAPDRSMAVGAAWPAIHRREPARRGQQHRHRGGRTRACRWLHASLGRRGQCDQCNALRQAQLQFHPRHCASRSHQSRALLLWWSIRRFRPERCREFIAYAKTNPGQDQHGDERQWHRTPDCWRIV